MKKIVVFLFSLFLNLSYAQIDLDDERFQFTGNVKSIFVEVNGRAIEEGDFNWLELDKYELHYNKNGKLEKMYTSLGSDKLYLQKTLHYDSEMILIREDFFHKDKSLHFIRNYLYQNGKLQKIQDSHIKDWSWSKSLEQPNNPYEVVNYIDEIEYLYTENSVEKEQTTTTIRDNKVDYIEYLYFDEKGNVIKKINKSIYHESSSGKKESEEIQIFKYNDKKLIEKEWINDELNGIIKFDENGNEIYSSNVNITNNEFASFTKKYDKHNNIIELIENKNKKTVVYKYTYEFDKNMNWVKRTTLLNEVPFYIVSRKITY